ncbi:MAG: efflux RND transporter permease subunit [Archangiaceae bacterium]|nr:efflux RND transporter permease subunit [Archangiaceae bacterium]
MNLSDVSIRRPVFTTMMSVFLVVLGIVGVRRLGTDLFPDVSFPFVTITCVYPGAGPSEIETQVIKPIEDSISGINGIETVQSFSRDNFGLVFAQFSLSASLDRSTQDVRDKVGAITNLLPKDAQAPRVLAIDIQASPVVTYAVSANMPSQELRQLIKDRLEPQLAQVNGVAEVRVTGGDEREIRVDIDLNKAKASGIAPGQIAERLGMENLNLPVGRLDLGPTELNVRTLGQFTGVDDIRALPIAKSQAGAQVRLDEIANVVDGVADRRVVARLNGKESVIVEVVKRPGMNTVEVATLVKKAMVTLEPQLGHDFHSTLIIDQSTLIEANTHEVWVALIFGGLMAILIILMFLLDLRGTMISALALPTSVVGTFFAMYVLGYSLNQMTLLALSLAIGLLIDDAVVVREAITHRLEQGETPMAAASNGTKDVALAVLATTLSLVAVFVPVAFMPGIVGQFFKQFGLTMSCAVLISLFVSFTLDPMLSARFARQRVHGEQRKENAVAGFFRRGFEKTERFYAVVLGWVIRNKGKTALATLVVLVASGLTSLKLAGDFVTPEDRSQFLVQLKLPEGSSLQESSDRAAEAEALIRQVPEVQDIYTIVGATAGAFSSDTNTARLRVLTVGRDKRNRGVAPIRDDARALIEKHLPKTIIANFIEPPVIEGLGDFYPVMLSIMGPDFEVLTKEANRIAGVMRSIPGTADIRIEANPPKTELGISIDRARSNDVDLTSAMLAMQLRLAMNGAETGKLREGSRETPIVVRLTEADRSTPEALKFLDIFTPKGVRTVNDVADFKMKDVPSVIEHFNRQRRVMIIANMGGGGGGLSKVASTLRERLTAEPPPEGYTIHYDGMMKTLGEQNEAFALAGILALVFVYMVLASQFESFKHPFTIIASVPLALIGALLSLIVTGYTLTLGAMIGVILLMGLVTKNGILLVDGTLQNLRAGDDLDTALLKAGPRRLRPILMTSVAMAIGMVPTAVGRGQGFEFRAPMAIAVIGGVITSTFLTLLVVPVVFAFFERLTFRRRPAPVAPPAPAPKQEKPVDAMPAEQRS